MTGERTFRMQRGPDIPWSLAETIYAAYSKLYGTAQTLERLNERGGFSWQEVEIIFSELSRRDMPLFNKLTGGRKIPRPLT